MRKRIFSGAYNGETTSATETVKRYICTPNEVIEKSDYLNVVNAKKNCKGFPTLSFIALNVMGKNDCSYFTINVSYAGAKSCTKKARMDAICVSIFKNQFSGDGAAGQVFSAYVDGKYWDELRSQVISSAFNCLDTVADCCLTTEPTVTNEYAVELAFKPTLN